MDKKNKIEDIEELFSEATEKNENQEQFDDQGDMSEEMTVEDELGEELAKEKDKFLRLFAEFENYKRRTSKERMELFKTAGQEIIVSLLPVLDDFDRAMKELSKAGDDDNELLKGVQLIRGKFRETLNSKGLQEVNTKKGDVFDAEIHEAITQIPAPKNKLKGKIIDVIEKGYKLGDKIIRHPKVVVGN